MKKEWENPIVNILGIEKTERDIIRAECHGWHPDGFCQLDPYKSIVGSNIDGWIFVKGTSFSPGDSDYIAWQNAHSDNCVGGEEPNWNPVVFYSYS